MDRVGYLPQVTSQSREVSGVQFDLLLSSKNICNAFVNEFGHFSIKAVKEKHLSEKISAKECVSLKPATEWAPNITEAIPK